MGHAQLLDCTLRDGAYLIDKKFGDSVIKGIINGLVKANVDYIEIGFFQDDGFDEGKTVFANSADAKRFIPKEKNGCEFTVLADYSRFSVSNLDERRGDSIDAVRECFFKKERYDAINACKVIKEKGYKLFVQPVDILGYSDKELIEFIELVNFVEPYCFSIVDTFGSMYQEDLHRVFELINHNLIPSCKIGFHSHNNMQLSNALSQEFIRMTVGRRNAIIDGTINGMGRGAGNTPTELVAQYMVSQLGYSYDIDAILDVVDGYMDGIRSRCTWGYSIPYFLAGCFSAHVNNITYLTKKNSIRSKDIRYILNKIGAIPRKRYDYNLLEKTYLELLEFDIDDTKSFIELGKLLDGEVLVVVPGSSAHTQAEVINKYIQEKHPIVISVNFLPEDTVPDYVFVSNVKRYRYWRNNEAFQRTKKIYTSNVLQEIDNSGDMVVSFKKLVKCGWERLDNSTIMLLRLLDMFGVKKIQIAGFDGYNYSIAGKSNYADAALELSSVVENALSLNKEIAEMLVDFSKSCKTDVAFLTPSRFEECFQ